jgi:hypothetical protein
MVIETLSGPFLDTHSRYCVFITAANECSTDKLGAHWSLVVLWQ